MIPSRLKRVNALLQETISEIVRKEVKDPRIAEFITMNEVRASSDLRTARVFVSVIGADNECEKAAEGLNSAAKFIRARLREKIKLKRIPELQFLRDDTIERGVRISNIIDQARERDKQLIGENDDTEGGS